MAASVPRDPPLLLSVNVSCKQLADSELVDFIRETIAESGIDPSSLKLEVTETTLMENPDQVAGCSTSCATCRCRWGSTTSAPAIRAWPCCTGCRSTCSRSTGRSSAR